LIAYPDSVAFLYSLGNEIKTIKLGLERIKALLDRLGNPQDGPSWVHVAGTNGKGSVSAMIESALRASGLRTGLYTSPHLVEPTERIRIDGEPVSPDAFAGSFETVHAAAVSLIESGGIDGHPTYFETVTAMGLLLFAEAGVEAGVIEVGLGGRLDATNVLHPQLCVITPVDYDHEAWLGTSIEAIAGEKAGIIKAGVPVVLGRQRPEAEGIIVERARRLAAPILRAGDWIARKVELHPRGCRFQACKDREEITVDCHLAGQHQLENALTAVAALRRLEIPAAAVQAGIASAKWPGRLELVRTRPEVILDGAHNPAGVAALARYIRRFYMDRKACVIYASMRDKSVEEIGGLLEETGADLILTAVGSPRALRPEALREALGMARARIARDLPAAYAMARELASDDGVIFITGSLLLVGEARAMLARGELS
jgi:dihydrofolate synthase/folylpolyglutamate synthase